VASKDASALIVGRADTLHVESPDACCVSEVLIENEQGKTIPVEWKLGKGDELELKVPLQNAAAGSLEMLVKKFGMHEADEITLHTYAEAARLDSFDLHAGDSDGILRGTRLDEVSKLEIGGVEFTPQGLSRANQHDELKLTTQNPAVGKLSANANVTAQVALKDGRSMSLSMEIKPPRPKLTLLNKMVQAGSEDPAPVIQLGNADELPQDATLNFVLKTQVPDSFPATERVEVATEDESFHVLLSEKDGNLTPQDSKTIFAVLDPMKLLGPSAFGPLKLRPVSMDGVEGDWQPLANVVRMPELKEVRCAAAPSRSSSAENSSDKVTNAATTSAPQDGARRDVPKSGAQESLISTQHPSHPGAVETSAPTAAADSAPAEKTSAEWQCTLSGDRLFLLDAISADADFSNSVAVPDGFVQSTLSVPAPKGNLLYIKLRDDPSTVDSAVVPIVAGKP
jgi:hypothetical protein